MKVFYLLLLTLFLAACSGKSEENANDEVDAVTEQEEMARVDDMIERDRQLEDSMRKVLGLDTLDQSEAN